MRYVGIDPGVSGAIAMIDGDGLLLELDDLPTVKLGNTHEIDIMSLDGLLSRYQVTAMDTKILLERAVTFPKDGRVGAFNMGANFARVQTVLTLNALQWTMILPQQWKKAVGLTSDKSASIVLAQRAFPKAPLDRKKDHNRAEALLLAEYLRTRSQHP